MTQLPHTLSGADLNLGAYSGDLIQLLNKIQKKITTFEYKIKYDKASISNSIIKKVKIIEFLETAFYSTRSFSRHKDFIKVVKNHQEGLKFAKEAYTDSVLDYIYDYIYDGVPTIKANILKMLSSNNVNEINEGLSKLNLHIDDILQKLDNNRKRIIQEFNLNIKPTKSRINVERNEKVKAAKQIMQRG